MTVSIIVINWNGIHYLKPCLEALRRQTCHDCEVILVDNASSDDSVPFIQEAYPEVKIVRLEQNKGFAGGNIEGMRVAKGDFIALINNDCRADEGWLENLLGPMLDNSQIGICASKLIVESTRKIDSAGDCVTTAGVGVKRGLHADAALYRVPEFVFGASAAAALYRRTMLDEIGFLDQDFFLNDEDTDLNFRAQLAGWKCLYVPSAVAYHKVNGTIGTLSDVAVYYHTRNLEFVWIKNMPAWFMFRFAHHKLLQELGAFCYLCLRHGKWKPYLCGKIDAIRMTPMMLRKRRATQQRKIIHDWSLKEILMSVFSRELIRQKIFQLLRG